ncbi:hypothetical protein [Parabacteroides sp.]
MKRLFLFVMLWGNMLVANAQDPYGDYVNFVRQRMSEYKDYRRKVNQEFASFLESYWKPFSKEQPIEARQQPEPEHPIVFNAPTPSLEPKTDPRVSTIPPRRLDPQDQPQPVQVPMEEIPISENQFTISYYGLSLRFPELLEGSFRLNGVQEKQVAAAWETMSSTNYKALLDVCQRYQSAFQLNDWAYSLLIRQVAEHLCGNLANEMAFMQMFFLSQSGYKAKIGRVGNRLHLMLPTNRTLYQTIFITIDQERYFLIGQKTLEDQSVYTYDKLFAYATKTLDLDIKQPLLLPEEIFERTLQSKAYKTEVTVQLNKNLIDFYKNCPQWEYPVYAQAPVCPKVYETLLPPLAKAVEGKTEAQAANLLINFVQTAFDYKTDHQQFGYEKPFFVEESLFYPYCDCEDRSILYAFLVEELLGLRVVFLNYPNHLATAVCFNEAVTGDQITYKGKNYLVCDPTYINAPIGKAMPQFKQTIPTVIDFNHRKSIH